MTKGLGEQLPGIAPAIIYKMVNLALVGKGRWGKNYLKTLETVNGARLKYVKTRNYPDLFEKDDLDGVIIATPSSTHFQIAKEFLKRGYNVLIEKPLTTNLADALKLKKLYNPKKSIVFVGHLQAYNPAFLKLKKLVKDIGQIRYISFEGLSSPIRDDTSVLWDWGPHGILLCLEVLGKMPNQVSARPINKLNSKLYDPVLVELIFPNKVSALLKFGWVYPKKIRELIIVGSKGTTVFDDTAGKKISYFEKRQPKVLYPHYSSLSPLKAEVLEFIDCIKIGRRPKTDLNQGLQIAKIIHLAEKSMTQGGKSINF